MTSSHLPKQSIPNLNGEYTKQSLELALYRMRATSQCAANARPAPASDHILNVHVQPHQGHMNQTAGAA